VAPLLLAVLGVAGRATGTALWGALAAALVMALAGLALAAGGLAGTTRLGALAVVWVGALVALGVLYRPVSRRAGLASDRRAQLFSMLRNVVLPVFVGYALVVTLAPAGLGVVGGSAASAGLLVVDLLGPALVPVVLARNVALLD
ncbi:MAG: bacteriorhodopsin, partial [Haloarculaceae archaeon]